MHLILLYQRNEPLTRSHDTLLFYKEHPEILSYSLWFTLFFPFFLSRHP